MSRSRKKPYYTDQQGCDTKKVKRSANRMIRGLPEDEVPARGSSYGKFFESWNICDWSFYCPHDKNVARK